jgi:hypothetical protein
VAAKEDDKSTLHVSRELTIEPSLCEMVCYNEGLYWEGSSCF